jgi:hypothetical protein
LSRIVLTCTARAFGSVTYLNHQISLQDNLTFRAEYFDDMQGSEPARKHVMSILASIGSTGFHRRSKSALRWTTYRSLDAPAFNGNANALPAPIPPNKRDTLIVATDLIWHY